jgi:opacity protein-like surface antigen
MRKLAIATAFASTMLATPAVARDGAWYAGVEGGLMIVEDTELDYHDPSISVDEGIIVDHKMGYDVDLIGGYDFGMFRLEAEAAHKRASVDQIRFAPTTEILPGAGNGVDGDGRVGVLSAMVNALLDFGDDDGWKGYVGAGVGLARVKYRAFVDGDTIGFSDSDDAMAWQAIAGFSKAVTPNVDVGLKYRYFNTRRLNFGNDAAIVPWALDGKLHTHSLLASVVYNFWTPAPPPPPVVETPVAPPPPATQTCPDGSVILATDVCPQPPAPPPPPPPEPERG